MNDDVQIVDQPRRPVRSGVSGALRRSSAGTGSPRNRGSSRLACHRAAAVELRSTTARTGARSSPTGRDPGEDQGVPLCLDRPCSRWCDQQHQREEVDGADQGDQADRHLRRRRRRMAHARMRATRRRAPTGARPRRSGAANWVRASASEGRNEVKEQRDQHHRLRAPVRRQPSSARDERDRARVRRRPAAVSGVLHALRWWQASCDGHSAGGGRGVSRNTTGWDASSPSRCARRGRADAGRLRQLLARSSPATTGNHESPRRQPRPRSPATTPPATTPVTSTPRLRPRPTAGRAVPRRRVCHCPSSAGRARGPRRARLRASQHEPRSVPHLRISGHPVPRLSRARADDDPDPHHAGLLRTLPQGRADRRPRRARSRSASASPTGRPPPAGCTTAAGCR